MPAIMTNNSSKKSIGVFDSGFGGLSILRSVVKALPQYDYVYLGDTARTPYGTRSQEVIYQFTEQAVDFLFGNNCELIIVACNTASSEALRRIQQEYLPARYPERRVLGVIIPAAEWAVEKTRNHRIGVMATESTVSSGAFARELLKLNPEIRVFQQGCPLLVPIVESGEQNSQVAELMIRKYVSSLLKQKVDTLILGCTHYGILESKIKKAVGKKVAVVAEGDVVAKKLKEYLKRHVDLESVLSRNSSLLFCTTDLTHRFVTLGGKFFGKKIEAQKVTLEPQPVMV